LAAILGDIAFVLARRVMLNNVMKFHPLTPIWSYLASYDHVTPVLGTFHGSDLLPTFFGTPQTSASQSLFNYYTNFAYTLDPNGSGKGNNKYRYWPKWNEGKQLLQSFEDKSTLLADDFRCDSYEVISKNIKSLRL
jgi:carboxylesterase type B